MKNDGWKHWNQHDIDFVVKNFEKMTNQELADHLGTTRERVKSLLFKKLNLKRSKRLVSKFQKARQLKRWTSQQDQLLIDNLSKPWDEIAKITQRTVEACKQRVFKLKRNQEKWNSFSNTESVKIKNYKLWTDEEIDFLMKNYPSKSINFLIQHLNRSFDSIHQYASHLGLRKNNRKNWSMSEVKYVIENYPTEFTSEIAKKLDRSKSSVMKMAFVQGVKKQQKSWD